MKKKSKILIKLLCFVMMITLFFEIRAFADVGDYGSSWDDSSNWGDSSYDSGYDYDYDYGDSSGGSYTVSSGGILDIVYFIRLIIDLLLYGEKTGLLLVIMVVGFIYLSLCTKDERNRNCARDWYELYGPNEMRRHVRKSYQNINMVSITGSSTLSEDIERQIKLTDKNFNREEFEAWVKKLFIQLQYAWTDRDWSKIRQFETNDLFEQHNMQIERFIKRKQINIVDRVSVNWVKLYKFYKTAEKEVLEVVLNSKMNDYVIDEQTRAVLEGNPTANKIRTYKLTFIRTIGVKTLPGQMTARALNCPNCGGQLTITQTGKCEYCGSIVVIDDHGWALSELEPFTQHNL